MIYNVTMSLHQFHLVCIPDVQNSIAVNGGRVEFWKGFFYCPANCILGEITGMSSSFVLYNRAPPTPHMSDYSIGYCSQTIWSYISRACQPTSEKLLSQVRQDHHPHSIEEG